jgi:hypothetical protein
VTVSYQTTSSALFGGYTGRSSLPLSGSSQASATVPPNIDFYLLLDNSPSMAIAATTAGINTMVNNTPNRCAFGCHESDTAPNDYYGAVHCDLQQCDLSRGHLHLQHRIQHGHAADLGSEHRAGAGRQYPTLRGTVSELEQRRDHQLHERDDADQHDHAESGRRH